MPIILIMIYAFYNRIDELSPLFHVHVPLPLLPPLGGGNIPCVYGKLTIKIEIYLCLCTRYHLPFIYFAVCVRERGELQKTCEENRKLCGVVLSSFQLYMVSRN